MGLQRVGHDWATARTSFPIELGWVTLPAWGSTHFLGSFLNSVGIFMVVPLHRNDWLNPCLLVTEFNLQFLSYLLRSEGRAEHSSQGLVFLELAPILKLSRDLSCITSLAYTHRWFRGACYEFKKGHLSISQGIPDVLETLLITRDKDQVCTKTKFVTISPFCN